MKRKKNPLLTSQAIFTCNKGHSILKTTCLACLSLKEEWYIHLEHSGFQEIENKDETLKTHKDSFRTSKDFQDPDLFQSRMSYYQWARTKINDGRFSSERDKLIWECHAEGLSTRQIAPRFEIHQSNVVRAINRIKEGLSALKSLGSMSMAQGIA